MLAFAGREEEEALVLEDGEFAGESEALEGLVPVSLLIRWSVGVAKPPIL